MDEYMDGEDGEGNDDDDDDDGEVGAKQTAKLIDWR